ncbi:MAG: clostripain-related cysteine peptidase [Bacillota bacterium]
MREPCRGAQHRHTLWTVLIYLAGAGGLEPAVSRSLLDLERARAEGLDVVVQLARAPQGLARDPGGRPANSAFGGKWTGARRYLLRATVGVVRKGRAVATSGRWTLVAERPDVNMADPHTLYDFVRWGLERASSPYRMVILSGHGVGILGALTDFANGAVWVMGVNGLARALSLAQAHAGKAIDVLVLDACYMNSLEVAYELAASDPPAARHLVVPAEISSLEGWPYRKILESLGQRQGSGAAGGCNYGPGPVPEERLGEGRTARGSAAVSTLIRCIGSACEYPPVAIKLDGNFFGLIKAAAHGLAQCLLAQGTPAAGRALSSLHALLRHGDRSHPCFGALRRLQEAAAEVIITGCEPEPNDRHRYLTVFVPTYPAEYREWSPYYETLQFARDNAWVRLLGGPLGSEEVSAYPGDLLPGPIPMPGHILVSSARL